MNYPGHPIHLGDAGDAVKAIQAKLGVWQTGTFGPTTEENVKTWQGKHGLADDGVVGPHTWAALFPGSAPEGATPAGGAFITCLRWTLRWEGGYSNNPNDAGGATMRGVTQAVYSGYLARHGQSSRPVRLISEDELQDIYRSDYWNKCGCDALPLPLAAAVFDLAVNGGIGRVSQLMARVPNTGDGRSRGLALCEQRRQWYLRIAAAHASQRGFLAGWLNRTKALKAFVNSL